MVVDSSIVVKIAVGVTYSAETMQIQWHYSEVMYEAGLPVSKQVLLVGIEVSRQEDHVVVPSTH